MLGGILYFKIGPKVGFSSMFLISALGSVFLMIFWERKEISSIFIIFTKFGVSGVYSMLYVAAVTMFPTVFAASIFGYCNLIARFFTIFSSIVAETDYTVALSVFLCVSGLAVVVSLFII
mmetsp:Transcript_490/g.962  ORF Transcript_490/g.962 Transcript_490/m.962 type:complete len:120 (+) Transcript_490:1236-1595(+)